MADTMADKMQSSATSISLQGWEFVDEDDGIPFRARSGYAHRTWARTYTSLPELFIQPESLEEVEKAVNLARKCRRRITTTGCGHSPSDITCTSSWLINLDNFNRVLSLDKDTGICVVQAGIRLFQLSDALDAAGLALPSLGSINEQSLAGAISTGTHGSSLHHGLISEIILALKITLADGTTTSCSPTHNPDLFRAALLSLGALGILVEITLRAVPSFSLSWSQTIDADTALLSTWSTTLWTTSPFTRVWWFPYMRRAVVWRATPVPPADLLSGAVTHRPPPTNYYESHLGYLIYHNLLLLAQYLPRITPWIERFVFGMTYGFRNGSTTSAVQPSRDAFLMNCLYSQHVNEWAIPLAAGPEALSRLGAWLAGRPVEEHNIPFDATGLWVHSPVEVRVAGANPNPDARPFLDTSQADGPSLYLNALMYRPYLRDPPRRMTERFYEGFEYLMRELGGRPHWAKTFAATRGDLEAWYGEDFGRFDKVRREVDPEGMFVGPWQRRYLLGEGEAVLPLEERGFETTRAGDGGWEVRGRVPGGEEEE